MAEKHSSSGRQRRISKQAWLFCESSLCGCGFVADLLCDCIGGAAAYRRDAGGAVFVYVSRRVAVAPGNISRARTCAKIVRVCDYFAGNSYFRGGGVSGAYGA